MTLSDRIISFCQYQLPMLAWCLFIYIASSIPSNNIAMLGGITDKFVHAGVFGMLCWLTHVALFHQTHPAVRRYSLLLAIIFTVLFGVSDEYHQMFTPGRSTDVYDLMADTAGGLIYAMVTTRLRFYVHQ